MANFRGKIECCNRQQAARMFELDPKGVKCRYLYFLDECECCGAAIAEIRQTNFKGVTKTIVRRSGNKAAELLKKKQDLHNFSTEQNMVQKIICSGTGSTV